MNTINIDVCDSPEQAPNYNKDGKGIKGAKLIKVIVVRNGTEAGNDTVDLQFEDQDGNKYVAMVTARILKVVTGMCITTNKKRE